MDGLENKLDGVHMGDLILLQSPQLEVTGYVVDYNPKRVKLSHENPFSEMAGFQSWNKYYRKEISSGIRLYNLRKFESYKVLRQFRMLSSPKL